MPRRTPPKYCHKKDKGRAFCRIDGRWINLGKYGTPESRAEYHRVVAEWLEHGKVLSTRRN